MSIQCFKSHKEAVHEWEKDSCDDCYYQTEWKEHLKKHNLPCFKKTTQKEINQMYYECYLKMLT